MTRHLFFSILTFLIFPLSLAVADDDADSLTRISGSDATDADWQWAARQMADKQARNDVRAAILSRDPYPRKELVKLLSNDRLAIRLGALELLEEAAGDGYGLNAWVSPSGQGADPANEHAIKLWHRWAGASGEIKASGNLLSDTQMHSYIRDIISGNPERKRRATRMLEPHGLKGVVKIQEFLIKTEALPSSSRINLKEAQYHLVLARTAGENASVLARDLTLGNRDQQLGALSALKKSGLLAIPIIRDFLISDDALVRETAVDSILVLGGAQAVPLVIPSLKTEKDVNVIHAALRRFREIGGTEVRDVVAGYLDREDEDLVVSAVESLTKLCAGGSSSSSEGGRAKSTPEINAKITQLLDDPRWRIRAAALEYVAKSKDRSAEDKVIELLGDEDEFVRAQAIRAAVALSLKKAEARLTKMFLTDDDMIAPATKALTGMGIVLPPKLIAHLDTRPADVVVGALKSLDRDKKPFLEIIARYATSKDLDIACAALRGLANDDDKLKFEFVANHITSALQSGQDEKIEAVLDSLRLPSSSSSSVFGRSYGSGNAPSEAGTKLDPLYDAFTKPGQIAGKPEKPVHVPAAKEADATGGLATLKDALAVFITDWEKPRRAFKASLLLAKVGDNRGVKALSSRVDLLAVSERAAIADGLSDSSSKEAVPLLQALMQDKVPDVRKDAANHALGSHGNTAMTEMAFNQLEVPNTLLVASDLYGYNVESSARSGSSKRVVLKWCRKILSSEEAKTPDDQTTILALILMRQAMGSSDVKTLEPFTKSSNQWIRRAAWYSLCRARSSWMNEHLESLVNDQSPKVRMVLPAAIHPKSGTWTHYFSDNKTERDRSWSSSSKKSSITSEQAEALLKLAEGDSSAEVRFESWFALLARGKSIDLNAFIRLLPQQPKESNVASRLASHLEKNYRKMGQGMKPLLAYADVKSISKSKLPLVLKHFTKGSKESSFTSFGALAKATESTGEPQHVESDTDPEKMAAERKRLVVMVFNKPGCKECEKVERFLAGMKKDFPLMEVERKNITDQRDLLVNQAICDRFQINGAGKAPAVFTQAGGLIAPATAPEAIADLLQSTMELPDDPQWNEFGSEEIKEAQVHVDESFSNMTMTIVILAGLLDGVNPCAFATIIFFLSYLQIARRSPKEILMVGIAFISAVFIAYFSIGLIFHGLVQWLNEQEGFHWVKTGMTYLFAAFALLVAVLSLRDGIRALRGRIQDMTLQLPSFLKQRIRGVIRKGAKSRSFVIAAFVSGIIISFLELACTGQVYAPIIFKIQQGSMDAVLYLLYYNLAFISPLILIFLLAYRGMTSSALIKFQEKHTATVKFATAILFFLLVLVILFGDKIIKLN